MRAITSCPRSRAPFTASPIPCAYRQRYALEWLSRASDLRIHHARPVNVDGHVVGVLLLSRSPRALFRGLYEDRGKIPLGIALIFGTLVVLSGLLSRGIARPIKALSEATSRVALGAGEDPESPATEAVEIQALYADFARMAEAIARRSLYLRDFAHAVSHEFKTPLAGIRGGIKILDDHGDSMDETDRRRFLANVAADANRLALLVTRLLELARADMAGRGEKSATELGPILCRAADAYRADRFFVSVEVDGALVAAVSPAVLETAVILWSITADKLGPRGSACMPDREGKASHSMSLMMAPASRPPIGNASSNRSSPAVAQSAALISDCRSCARCSHPLRALSSSRKARLVLASCSACTLPVWTTSRPNQP